MTPGDHDYQLMMNALADLTRRRDAELGSAERAYRDSTARAAGELSRAESEATAADRWAAAAAAQVLDVDRDAARLWDQLRRVRSLRLRSLGDLPEPSPVESLPRVALPRVTLPRRPTGEHPQPTRDSARALLARAAERIDQTRPPTRRPLPRWTLPLLPLLGALIAAAAGLLAAGLVTMGDAGLPGGAAIRTVGWICFVVAPSAGVPVAALLAHRRLRSRLDVGGVGLTLLGGMVAATLLSLSFAASH